MAGRTLKPKRRLELSQTGHTSVHCDRGSCALGAGESALRALCCVVLNSSSSGAKGGTPVELLARDPPQGGPRLWSLNGSRS